jgi:hypothetical protein
LPSGSLSLVKHAVDVMAYLKFSDIMKDIMFHVPWHLLVFSEYEHRLVADFHPSQFDSYLILYCAPSFLQTVPDHQPTNKLLSQQKH